MDRAGTRIVSIAPRPGRVPPAQKRDHERAGHRPASARRVRARQLSVSPAGRVCPPDAERGLSPWQPPSSRLEPAPKSSQAPTYASSPIPALIHSFPQIPTDPNALPLPVPASSMPAPFVRRTESARSTHSLIWRRALRQRPGRELSMSDPRRGRCQSLSRPRNAVRT